MTLEEIKNEFNCLSHDDRISDEQLEMVQWLIAEVERLQAENHDLHQDGMTIYAMMGGSEKSEVMRLLEKQKEISQEYQQELIDTAKEMMTETAKRCADIAGEFSTALQRTELIAEAIRKEFGV